MEEKFYDAANGGKVEEVKSILRKNPSLNVNWKNEQRDARTALYSACFEGHDSVVSILLAHPGISPNLKQKDGSTPFYYACCGRPSCVREMLKDSRVKVNDSDRNGYTPLRYAYYGELDIIKWWIASRREMDLGKPGDVDGTDAIGVAKQNDETEVVTLLERFKSDAVQTRHAMRVELGWYDEAAAEMFALVVFVSDEILRHHSVTCSQVLLHCHPAPTGAPDGVVPSRGGISQGYHTRQVAFKSLAKRLVWSTYFANEAPS